MLDLAIHNAYCIFYSQLLENKLIEDSKQIGEEEEFEVRDMFHYGMVLGSSDNDSGNSAKAREVRDNMTYTSVPSSSTATKKIIKLNEFKRIICEQLTKPFLNSSNDKPKREAFNNQNHLMQWSVP